MKRKTDKKRWGFTLVELLTTLAVIGVLLGLLIPALNEVTKKATQVKQKAQFHAIGNALEAFRNDYGDYPPSAYNNIGADYAVGSHHLAEALVGRDGLGFHSSSQFRADGFADLAGDGIPDDVIYGDPSTYTAETPAQNLAARKGPYLELESANAVKLGSIFPTAYPQLNKNAFVLVDMYKQVKNTATSKEVGMPILYYRANRLKIGNSANPPDWDMANTYSINDSFCNSLGIIKPGSGHYGDDVPTNAS
ncbi:MAG: type II secretion system protein, partial [Planctomycetota bacterium]